MFLHRVDVATIYVHIHISLGTAIRQYKGIIYNSSLSMFRVHYSELRPRNAALAIQLVNKSSHKRHRCFGLHVSVPFTGREELEEMAG